MSGGRRARVEWPVVDRLKKVSLLAAATLLAMAVARADQPLSQDDVNLLLIGGASQAKLIDLIQTRGIDFQMTPELAKKFRGEGASDQVIQALEKASSQLIGKSGSSSESAEEAKARERGGAAVAPAGSAGQGASSPGSASASAPGGSEASSKTGNASASAAPKDNAKALNPAAGPAVSSGKLSDPTPEQIQKIIQEFAAKETLFKQARNNYTYHQINKVETLDADDQPTGVWQQDWDILYDDNGKRIERVTYAPLDTLKDIQITEEDLDAFRHIQPFVLTTDELPDYDIQYLGHVKLDELTTYVFRIRPKEIKKGRQYFQGEVWVDDRDLQIVKTEGKQVPEIRTKHGGENLFPRFTTYREQIDGKFWFPTFTIAKDTLYFSSGPVRIREIIRYTDYKQFKSTVKTRVISTASGLPDQQKPDPGKKDQAAPHQP